MKIKYHIFFYIVFTILFACKNTKPIYVSVIPTKTGTEMSFVGYVTDSEKELIGSLHYFSRSFRGEKDIDGKKVSVFSTNEQEWPFYTDQEGSVWQKNSEDLSKRIVKYGFKTEKPVKVSFWQPLLKMNDGKNTTWNFKVDTTFFAKNADGKTNKIRYYYLGEAEYGGWSKLIVPERRDKPYDVISANWKDLKTLIINSTTGDTLFSMVGNASQFFEPMIGSIRYQTDYTLKEIGEEQLFRMGTWELTNKKIPN